MRLKEKLMKKRCFTKKNWYAWLINYIFGPMKNRWVMFKTKLCVYLKETQPKIIGNQHVATLRMQEGKQENQK